MRHFYRIGPVVRKLGIVASLAGVFSACSKPDSPGAGASPTQVSAAPGAGSGALPASSGPPGASPIVTIPAGKLIAGTPCSDHPRLPSEEPAGISIDMNEFTIDAYPYPNDPEKAPITNLSQSEAKALCEARGRRLCTELEWERACKGPYNTKYEYASRFDPKRCPNGFGPMNPAGSKPSCKSEFGVFAMHGFVFEWTSSAWGRGEEGNSVVLRGGYGDSPYAHMRCSAAKSSPADAKANSIGFRCCGGPENTAKVGLGPSENLPALEPVEPIEPALSARLKKAVLNGQLKDEPGFSYSFDKVWRWRPVKHEEIYLARYIAKPEGEGAARVQPVVILLCDKTAQLLSKIRGPVDSAGEPALSGEASSMSLKISLSSGSDTGDARFSYRFGQVNLAQPDWVKETNGVKTEGSASAPMVLPSASASASAAPAPPSNTK